MASREYLRSRWELVGIGKDTNCLKLFGGPSITKPNISDVGLDEVFVRW
jgi:hypothetical protein